MERRKFLALVTIIAVILVSVASAVLYTGILGSNRNHDPIAITSDEEFTKNNGVTGGSGTKEDPYIIEEWTIDSSGVEKSGPEAAGILIKGTTAYLTIRNISISGPSICGILFENVVNGKIENSTVTSHAFGIVVNECQRCDVIMNRISSCMTGMEIGNLTEVTISDNRFLDGTGIDSDSTTMMIGLSITNRKCENVTISRNEFGATGFEFHYGEMPNRTTPSGLNITTDNTVNDNPVYFAENQTRFDLDDCQVGQVILLNCDRARLSNLTINGASTCVYLGGVDNVSISQCTISNGNFMGGVWARESRDIRIDGSRIEDACVYIQFCENVTIRENIMADCQTHALYIQESGNVSVFLNDFINNTVSAMCTLNLPGVCFSNEILRKGNYWSDYDGEDLDLDGIGDTPYVLFSLETVSDDYPLMNPVNS